LDGELFDTFGGYLRAHRKLMGYTQHQVGYYLCVSQTTVSDWENNVTRPTRAQLALLEILLDISEQGYILYAQMTPTEERAAQKYMEVITELWGQKNLGMINDGPDLDD
jgi:transcriptional regulator with XRE-family HTH domain